MEFLGLSEGAFRFTLFASILVVMALAETLQPRRARRFSRTQRWRTNFGILIADYVSVFVAVFIGLATAVVAAAFAENYGFGIMNLTPLPLWIEAIAAFILLDFAIWFQHWATHKIPILWRIHRVHHTDEDMDASTAVRFHPLEILFSIVFKSAVVVMIGAPALIVVLFEAFVNGTALFNHANLKLPKWVDAPLRLILVTPDMHRVHHSVRPQETNSNYGFGLSIWDRLFGTYIDQPQDGHDSMKLGLAEWQDERPTKLHWTLLMPFVNPPADQQKPDTINKS